jgi:hypothetical protein
MFFYVSKVFWFFASPSPLAREPGRAPGFSVELANSPTPATLPRPQRYGRLPLIAAAVPGGPLKELPGTLPCHQCCVSFLLLIAMRLADSHALLDTVLARLGRQYISNRLHPTVCATGPAERPYNPSRCPETYAPVAIATQFRQPTRRPIRSEALTWSCGTQRMPG